MNIWCIYLSPTISATNIVSFVVFNMYLLSIATLDMVIVTSNSDEGDFSCECF